MVFLEELQAITLIVQIKYDPLKNLRPNLRFKETGGKGTNLMVFLNRWKSLITFEAKFFPTS